LLVEVEYASQCSGPCRGRVSAFNLCSQLGFLFPYRQIGPSRLKSGSIWLGVVLHAAHNTFIQQFFDPLTVDKSKTRHIAGEFGAGLAAISILLAFYF